MKYLIGIDIGTSGTKTVLFDENGKSMASKTIDYPMYQPENGWAEQEPEDWWNATVKGIKSTIAESRIDKDNIAGIGLSGQMHGLVLLDKENKVLRKSIIWCDQRTGREVGQMNEIMPEKKWIEITANPAMTGFTAAKILWVKNNEPGLYKECAHILLPKDYIRFKLTGEYATEVSDASGMQLLDVPNRKWSTEILEKLNIDISVLPKMHESPDVTGNVTKEVAELTGLKEGTPVVGGAGDNAAAAIGTGVVKTGTAFNTIGTSGVIYTVTDKPLIDAGGRVHTFCASVPGKWTVMSCTQGAGLSLKWLLNTCGENIKIKAKNENISPYEIMDNLAEEVRIGSDKLLFLPYLMGERSPHLDPDCRGVFFGLSAIHEQKHLVRAVLEGVAFSQRECFDVFREMGIEVDTMTICGGGSRSFIWKQMLADIYGLDVDTLEEDQGGALGAAILAGVGVGVYESLEDATDKIVIKGEKQKTSLENKKEYEKYFNIYKKIYRNLENTFDDFSKVE